MAESGVRSKSRARSHHTGPFFWGSTARAAALAMNAATALETRQHGQIILEEWEEKKRKGLAYSREANASCDLVKGAELLKTCDTRGFSPKKRNTGK